jgi:hypothetical protein
VANAGLDKRSIGNLLRTSVALGIALWDLARARNGYARHLAIRGDLSVVYCTGYLRGRRRRAAAGVSGGFWMDQAHADESPVVMYALDCVSVQLQLGNDGGREVDPAGAELGKSDWPITGLPQVLQQAQLLGVSKRHRRIVSLPPERVASGWFARPRVDGRSGVASVRAARRQPGPLHAFSEQIHRRMLRTCP